MIAAPFIAFIISVLLQDFKKYVFFAEAAVYGLLLCTGG